MSSGKSALKRIALKTLMVVRDVREESCESRAAAASESLLRPGPVIEEPEENATEGGLDDPLAVCMGLG